MRKSHSSTGRRRSRERRRRLRQRVIVSMAVLAAMVLTALTVASLGRGGQDRGGFSYAPPDDFDPDGDLVEVADVASSKDVYPYSVIPGGVQSPEEFTAARDRDPVVAQHYNDVASAELRVEHVSEPTSAYMSYRIGDRVYWTKNKLPLRLGETILTDGDTTIRGRCGNRVSEDAMAPISDHEPTAEAFERLDVAAAHGERPDDAEAGAAAGSAGDLGAGSGEPQLMARNDGSSAFGFGNPGGWGGGGPIGFYGLPGAGGSGSGTPGNSGATDSGSETRGAGGGGSGSGTPGNGNGGGGGPANPLGELNVNPDGSGGSQPEWPDENTPSVEDDTDPEPQEDPRSVPEPALMMLLAAGAAGLAICRARARHPHN